MQIVKQLSVFLENRPGAFYRLSQDFAKNEINIKAISVSDTVDHAVVRLVVDEPVKAIHILEEVGVLVIDNEIIEMPLDNQPGKLTKLCGILVEKGVNLEYAYGSASDTNGYLYLKFLDPRKALEILKDI